MTYTVHKPARSNARSITITENETGQEWILNRHGVVIGYEDDLFEGWSKTVWPEYWQEKAIKQAVREQQPQWVAR